MTVLGGGGLLHFRREKPEALLLQTSDRRPNSISYQPALPEFWCGDFVALSADGAVPLPPSLENCYVHVDSLRRLSFYVSQKEANIGSPADRLPLPPPECGTITATPLVPEHHIVTELDDWTLHFEPTYLNELLIERQLGTGMVNLCSGGGKLTFHHNISYESKIVPEVVQISHQLNKFDDLLAEFNLTNQITNAIGYKVPIKPLSYVLNTRDLPHIQGTIEFAVISPLSLLHS